MANTANTQEPTMEEILASIRRIISEDGEEAKPAAAEPPKAKPVAVAPTSTTKPAKAQPVVATEDVEEDDVLELTEIVPEEDEEPETVVQVAPAAEDDVVMVERAPMKSAPRPPVVSRPRMAEPEEGLLTREVREQASSSFMQLSRTTLVSDHPAPDSRSLEALVQDMLRPLLEDWLNRNLPEIVDRLVQQEIDRVSRKGGRL